MEITIHGKTFIVTKAEVTTKAGRTFNMFELKGKRATYYTCSYVNHSGRHFILDCKAKIANVFRGVDLIEKEDGSLVVA